MKQIGAILSILLIVLSANAGAADTAFMDYQSYNDSYCSGCSCQPCGCETPCPQSMPCDPCNPCGPVCGTDCGMSLVAVGIGIAPVAAAAAIIATSGNGGNGDGDGGGSNYHGSSHSHS